MANKRTEIVLTTMGRRGATVTPYVREERGSRVYFRFPNKGSGGGYAHYSSDLVWPVAKRQQDRVRVEAEARALRMSDARRRGLGEDVIKQCAMGEDLPSGAFPSSPASATVAAVMREAIGPSPRGLKTRGVGSASARIAFWRNNPPSLRGLYQSWTPEARQARREADRIEDAWGSNTPFLTKTSNDLAALWRPGVADNAERRVRLALQVSAWAAREYAQIGYTPLSMGKRGWKLDIADATSPAKSLEAHDVRYEAWEAGALWLAAGDTSSDVDWHVRFAVLVGGEARLGQVIRSTVDDVQNVGGAYFLKPPQAGKKLTGVLIVPRMLQIRFGEAVDEARARSDGDRRIFPISRHKLALGYRALETKANIRPRGPYALRRTMIDLAPLAMANLVADKQSPLDVVDQVVLEAISHHRPRGVRDSVYRTTPVGRRLRLMNDTPLMAILQAAARVRDHARHLAEVAARAKRDAEELGWHPIWHQTDSSDEISR